ncbi:fatty acid desaturase [Synechococcus sp. M16CYN]|uniref:fatty acid desaturase n=1 Tax=Synechococcus sp. M16CYN TaxID=3103139 RepID=UPI0033409243
MANEIDLVPIHRQSLLIATLVGLAWLLTLVIAISRDIHQWTVAWILTFIILRSFLHTGLFILAHDAMHYSLAPLNKELNNQIGKICLFLYAGLSFESCSQKHSLHHQFPESPLDPDFHLSVSSMPFNWYFKFLMNYLGYKQLFILVSAWFFMLQIINSCSIKNIIFFCILPLIISSFQLFTVGTWLPHKQTGTNSKKRFPSSLSLHPIISFAACYHFGYHLEHHLSPNTPWFKLPDLHRTSLKSELASVSVDRAL